jgi:hypothetical protein
MAWYAIEPQSAGKTLYGGDDALDAFATAVKEIVRAWQSAHGRPPSRDEIEEAARVAFERAGHGGLDEILGKDPIRAAATLSPGALFTVPYGPSIDEVTWAQLLAPHPSRGWAAVIFDRDARAGDELADVARSKWLLGPLFVNTTAFDSGLWRVEGHAPLRELPHLVIERQVRELGSSDPPRLRHESFDGEEADVSSGPFLAIDGDAWMVSPIRALRALRGRERWKREYDALRAPEASS